MKNFESQWFLQAFYLTISYIILTSSMAPFPMSPHINFLEIESMIVTPQFYSFLNCSFVTGCKYISVFIAGQIIKGFFNFCEENSFLNSIFQARATKVNRLSAIPLEILAKLFALRGAIK